MAKKTRDEDLFQETSMTFGEHLDELRICLWRAVIGLMIGFCLGLFVGKYVVQFIQYPLEQSLSEFLQQRATEQLEAEAEQISKAGYPADIAEIAKEQRLLPERVWINPEEFMAKVTGEADTEGDGVSPTVAEAGGEPSAQAAESAEAQEAGSAEATTDFPRVEIYLWHDRDTDPRLRPKSLNAHEAFMIWVKASLVVGVLISSPWVLWQIWSFVAAGLYPQEKHYAYVFLPISLVLFLSGAALAFFVVFRFVLNFLFMFNESLGIEPDLRISEWMSFVIMLPLGFGIAFQLPLVMLFLERIGIFTVKTYLEKWRVAILVICVVSMFLTPSDPQSMIAMAIPLIVLYFGGIAMCRYMPKRKSAWSDFDDEDDKLPSPS